MTSFVKSALRRIGFDLVRYVPTLDRSFPVLPYVVRERLHPQFFFVQIGANDGVHGDPIRDLVLQHDLAGILVEPLPDLFARLRENYANSGKLRFENLAIGPREGTSPIYRVRPGTREAPRRWFDVAGFDRNVLLYHGIPTHVIEAINVPITTFDTLLAKHHVSNVDLLQVDTEGYDGVIVRAALAAGLRPSIINFESCHLPPSERYDLRRLLDANGYRFLDVARDTLAVRLRST